MPKMPNAVMRWLNSLVCRLRGHDLKYDLGSGYCKRCWRWSRDKDTQGAE
jgi:hypothetical protein